MMASPTSQLVEEVAALREENAREREAHLHWKAEAHRLTEERDDLATEMDIRQIAARVKISDLRAHVAALVAVVLAEHPPVDGDPALDCLYHGQQCPFHRVIHAPDLAALVAREQAREKVVKAARAWVASWEDDAPVHDGLDVPTADPYESAELITTRDALAALDAVETPW